MTEIEREENNQRASDPVWEEERYRAVGELERAPDIEEGMAIFEEEEWLAQASASDTLRFLRLNVTQDVIQKSTLPGMRLPMTTGDFRTAYFPLAHEEDVPRLGKLLERENLLKRFESVEQWLFIDYRLRDGAAYELLRILGRFCRILVDGSVMVAHLTNTEFAVFRVNPTTPEKFHTALLYMYQRTCVPPFWRSRPSPVRWRAPLPRNSSFCISSPRSTMPQERCRGRRCWCVGAIPTEA